MEGLSWYFAAFNRNKRSIRYPTPELGADTASGLRALGYSDADIAVQRTAGDTGP